MGPRVLECRQRDRRLLRRFSRSSPPGPPRLASLLASFSTGYSPIQVAGGIRECGHARELRPVSHSSSRSSITRNFVSPDNGTMIVIYNFSVPPTDKMIAAFRADVTASSVPSLGTYYVTGGAVLTSDITKVFGPVVGVTVVPGVIASLAIVGLLLLAPLAAIIPVLVGGVAIAIALPVIYYGVVDVGHGTLTFLTPSLTVLLVLGLAVDYSVLQLRRTREERIEGRLDRGERRHIHALGGPGRPHRRRDGGRRLHRHGRRERPALQRRRDGDRHRRLHPHSRGAHPPPLAGARC